MLFHMASWLRHYVNRFTTWLLLSALSLDAMTDELLKQTKRYWHPMVRLTVRKRKGVTVLRFKNLE